MVTLVVAATVWAQPAGTSGKASPLDAAPKSAVLPSIEILGQQSNLAGTCGGATFNLNTYIHVDTQASADVRVSATGFPNLEQLTDETGTNIGPYNGVYPTFNIPAFGGGLPPNTPMRIFINTYTGKALSGTLSYSSTIQFDCTTGAVLNVVAGAPGDPAPIPAFGTTAWAATTLLLTAAALAALRRRRARSTPVAPGQRRR
jgi:hypothetical protein